MKAEYKKIAKNFCKEMRIKLEDVYDDMFIASVIGKQKVGSSKDRHYSEWKTIKYRTSFVYQIIDNGDVVLILNNLGGKYHKPNTSFIFTSAILHQLNNSRIQKL